jgi:hypothetical protein
MSLDSTPPDKDALLLAHARAKLTHPQPKDRHWAALAAAAFFALCAMGFAVASIMAPPLSHDPAAKSGVH